MNPEQVRQMAHRFIDQLHKLEEGDPAGIDEMVGLFSEDAQITNPLIEQEAGQRAGAEEVARFWKEYKSSFRDIHSEFTDVTVSPQSAGLFWESRGTDPNGRPLVYKGVSRLVLNDAGKIRAFTGYFDSPALRQRPG